MGIITPRAYLLLVLCLGAPTAFAQTITLNPSQTYQTINGWEATSEAGQMECSTFDRYKDEMMSRLVNELGINRIRLEIRSGVEHSTNFTEQFFNGQISLNDWKMRRYDTVNDNGNPYVINPDGFHFNEMDQAIEEIVLPMRQHLRAMGEELFVNVNYVHFQSEDYIHLVDPEEYAEFVLATYQHIDQKYGFVPDSWEVILEPDNTKWNGTAIGRSIVAAAARLQAHGYSPSFVAPSVTNMNNFPEYFAAMAAVPGALQHVDLLSYHRYKGPTLDGLYAIVELAEQHQRPVAMLERLAATYQTLHEDLGIGNNVAWQQYGIGFCNGETGGDYYFVDESNAQNPVVHIDTDSKFFRQYFRYIRRGAVRIGASSDDGVIDPLAFVHPDGRYVVVVKATNKRSFNVKGLPAGTYGVRYTTDSEVHADGGQFTVGQGEALNTQIPARGALTIFRVGQTGGGSSQIGISRENLSFGTVDVGDTKALSFSVQNTGTALLTINGISSSSPRYTVDPANGTIPAGGSLSVTVTFSPDAVGSASGTLTVQSNAPGSPHEVSLNGSGAQPGAPLVSLSRTGLAFGEVDIGGSKEMSLSVENTGQAVLRITEITTTSSSFEAAPSSGTVDPGSSLPITVLFSPSAEGSSSAFLRIVSDAAGSPHEVELTGRGAEGTNVDDERESLDGKQFALEQNYPNPFQDQTTVRYSLPEGTHVNIVVFDQLGRKVASLVDRYQSPGIYAVEIDPRDWPNGIYAIAMQAGDFRGSRLMTLLR